MMVPTPALAVHAVACSNPRGFISTRCATRCSAPEAARLLESICIVRPDSICV